MSISKQRASFDLGDRRTCSKSHGWEQNDENTEKSIRNRPSVGIRPTNPKQKKSDNGAHYWFGSDMRFSSDDFVFGDLSVLRA